MESTRPSLPALFRGLSRSVLIACLLGGALLQAGCVDPAKPQVPGPTTVVGRVVHASDVDRGVAEVTVRAVGKRAATATDSTGWFDLTLEAADGEIVQVTLSKPGFDEVTTSFAIRSGTANRLPATVQFYPLGTSHGGDSGPASSIVLRSTSAHSIGVRHSGSNESALLVFEVRDSQGRPVNAAHRALIQFSLAQLPSGGASLSADTASTDTSGLVRVTLNAGSLAQSVQVRGQVAASSIYSEVVTVAIQAGPPDAAHFSFAPASVNIPGLVGFGIENPVTAFVGDRHGNPVAEGTVVYFSSTGGLIQASARTDDHGRATVDLIAAEPHPNASPVFSDSAGIARISVQTMGEAGSPIIRSGLAVVFSGHTELSVAPQIFTIPANGSQDFTVTVWDREHHNALTKGTTITFQATVGTTIGRTTVVLPDTRDRQYTSFVFTLENYSDAVPALVGPDRARIRLVPGASQADSRLAAASAGGPLDGGITTTTALARAIVTVTVTSANGDAIATATGDVDLP